MHIVLAHYSVIVLRNLLYKPLLRLLKQTKAIMEVLVVKIFLSIALMTITAESTGILFPRESETREVKSLDGLWKFTISPSEDENIGFRECWFAKDHQEWISMPVPSSYNDVTASSTIRDFVGWAWYQRVFFTPRRWDSDNIVFLRFGSVHYTAMVWVNGQFAGNHSGGHLPFQFDVTKVLLYGAANLITVAVNNTLTLHTIPQGSVEHMNDTDMYPPGYIIYSYNFDFYNYAGIHRPVYLYTTPLTYIDDISVNTYVEENNGIIQYGVVYNVYENDIPGDVECEVSLLDGSHEVVSAILSCEGNLFVKDAKLWWPVHMSSNPAHLYTLQVRLLQNDKEDIYRLPVGIRVISWDGGMLKINHQPCYLRGFGKHEDSNLRGKGLDYPLLVRDHSLIDWIGANAYRSSHYPYAEEALDMADSLGILVIDESPAVNLDNFDAQLLESHKAVMTDLIQRDKNRPSVVMWSLSNEARSQRKEAGPHFRAVVEHVKNLDGSRPVTFVTNQKYETDQAAQYMDIIGVNRYFSWYSDTGKLDLIPHQVESEFTKWHETFNKSLFMSEYGADAVSGMHMLPSFVWTEDYQAELLKQHFKAFDKLREKGFFLGEMIWNFADFATKQDYKRVIGNHKGIFTRERQPKEAAYVLRSRYQALAEFDRKNYCPPEM